MALIGPALIALMAPFWLVAGELASEPAARAIVAHRPLLAVELIAGLMVLLAIFGWPLVSLARQALNRRRISIDGAFVTAREQGPLGTSTWTEPLSAYLGVTRRVRSSLSGVRHELVLVHPRQSRSVVLHTSALISQDFVEQAARLLALAEIPSREASNVAFQQGSPRLAEPQSRLGAAAL
jgi:hypothetical protein